VGGCCCCSCLSRSAGFSDKHTQKPCVVRQQAQGGTVGGGDSYQRPPFDHEAFCCQEEDGGRFWKETPVCKRVRWRAESR